MCVLSRLEVVNYAKNYCCGHCLREIPFLIHRLCLDAFHVISQLSGENSDVIEKGQISLGLYLQKGSQNISDL